MQVCVCESASDTDVAMTTDECVCADCIVT